MNATTPRPVARKAGIVVMMGKATGSPRFALATNQADWAKAHMTPDRRDGKIALPAGSHGWLRFIMAYRQKIAEAASQIPTKFAKT